MKFGQFMSRAVTARKYTKSRDAPAQLFSANLNVLLFYRFCVVSSSLLKLSTMTAKTGRAETCLFPHASPSRASFFLGLSSSKRLLRRLKVYKVSIARTVHVLIVLLYNL